MAFLFHSIKFITDSCFEYHCFSNDSFKNITSKFNFYCPHSKEIRNIIIILYMYPFLICVLLYYPHLYLQSLCIMHYLSPVYYISLYHPSTCFPTPLKTPSHNLNLPNKNNSPFSPLHIKY